MWYSYCAKNIGKERSPYFGREISMDCINNLTTVNIFVKEYKYIPKYFFKDLNDEKMNVFEDHCFYDETKNIVEVVEDFLNSCRNNDKQVFVFTNNYDVIDILINKMKTDYTDILKRFPDCNITDAERLKLYDYVTGSDDKNKIFDDSLDKFLNYFLSSDSQNSLAYFSFASKYLDKLEIKKDYSKDPVILAFADKLDHIRAFIFMDIFSNNITSAKYKIDFCINRVKKYRADTDNWPGSPRLL